jgi:hypothetical protein
MWHAYFGQLEACAPFLKQKLIVNEHEKNQKIPKDCDIIFNKETDAYHKRFVESMSEISEDHILYMQEDFLLYDKVDRDKIEKINNFLTNSEYSFVRLMKSGVEGGELIEPQLNIYKVPHRCGNVAPRQFQFRKSHAIVPHGNAERPYIFSYQATLWKRKHLIKLFDFLKPENLPESELYGSYACLNLNIKGCYVYNNEPKRGSLHYDSSVYPYISTALYGASYGKPSQWAMSSYKNELGPILKRYNIDPTTRGII